MAAKTNKVWGLDVGLHSLKALCVSYSDGIVRYEDSFYTEHNRNGATASPEAVEQSVRLFAAHANRTPVVVGLSGNNCLSRFIRLPPVAKEKVADIMRYEARQQIPYSLDDVNWDWQKVRGYEESGFTLESECILQAVKKEYLDRTLCVLKRADSRIRIKAAQANTVALFNAWYFENRDLIPPLVENADEYLDQEAGTFTMLISTGAEHSDLVVTNGYQIWFRSIGLGGNHFIRALAKERNISFSEAEKLGIIATSAVENDFVTEIQRSIGYYTAINRGAQLKQIIFVGPFSFESALKGLFPETSPGWYQYPGWEYKSLACDSAPPEWKEKALSYVIAYGLGLQGLDMSKIKTNLMPVPKPLFSLSRVASTIARYVPRVSLSVDFPYGAK